jgi:hypothetical protein
VSSRSPRKRRRPVTRIAIVVVAVLFAGSVIVSAVGGSRLAREAQRAPGPADSPHPPTKPPEGSRASTDQAEGDAEEELTLRPARGKSSAAGDPEEVTRQFALAWTNRPTNRAELRAQNQRLVSLSRGFFADQIGLTLRAKTGSGSRGTVVGVQVLRRSDRSEVALLTTREQLAPGGKPAEPYHYDLYLVRLERVEGGFAVSSWEPQF